MSITTTDKMMLEKKAVLYLYTEAPNSIFCLNTHHIECSSKRNQWYLNPTNSTFGELPFIHQTGQMVHQRMAAGSIILQYPVDSTIF